MSNTSCNGRITGFMMSLSQEQNGSDYPRIEVWSPKSSPMQYKMRTRGQYRLTEHNIKNMTKYYFATVSFAKNAAMKFEKGSFIGCYIPPNSRYTVWSINNTGYSYYVNRRKIRGMNLNITRALNVYTTVNDSQPLIQVVFGKL